MKRLSPITRIALGFVSITTGILLLAYGLGLSPTAGGAALEQRKAFCEQLAIHSTFAAQRGDFTTLQAIIPASIQRHPDILSAGLRRADGKLLVAVNDHHAAWVKDAGAAASTGQIRVPISGDNKVWGQIEVRFRPLAAGGALGFLASPAVTFFLFCGLFGFAAYFVYLRFILRALGGNDSQSVPKRVRTTLNTLAEGVVILDCNNQIVMANEAFAGVLGQSAADLQGRKVSELPWTELPGRSEGGLPWEKLITEGTPQIGRIVGLKDENDGLRTLSVNSTPIVGEDGAHKGAFATFDNLTVVERKNVHLKRLLSKLKHSRTEIRRQNLKLQALATRDPLTGCFNRRAFFPEFESSWSAAQRYGTPLSCVMVDIDRFKSINDSHGHSAGDQVLQHVAAALQSLLRKSDVICRYGGEEFCILLNHSDIEQAAQAAERFRAHIEAQTCANIRVTVSIGVSAFGLGAIDPRNLLDEADKALYAAKRTGRNRVIRWDRIADDAELSQGKPAAPAQTVETAGQADIPFHAVTALFSALAYRHADTAEHSRRVADFCVAAANGLMSQSDCYILEVAALLHDIGKLGVPDAVLLKPGPLNKEEWRVIRTHEGIGEEIITAAFTSPKLSSIIRNHHCWYEGSPHDPNLPRGQDIPLGARILSIADAYDAMVSDRVYRKGRNHEQAAAELRRCASRQFDPELVECFLKAVTARDENRTRVAFSKQTALQIGMQLEKLAIAADAKDVRGLAAMATSLNGTASRHALGPIADAAAQLEKSAGAGHDMNNLLELTLKLMDLCRATYDAYLPQPPAEEAMKATEHDLQLVEVGQAESPTLKL